MVSRVNEGLRKCKTGGGGACTPTTKLASRESFSSYTRRLKSDWLEGTESGISDHWLKNQEMEGKGQESCKADQERGICFY